MGIQRVFIPSSMHFHPYSTSILHQPSQGAPEWHPPGQTTPTRRTTATIITSHTIQPSIPFHCQYPVVRFQAYHGLLNSVQLPCDALQAVHRRAGPSQLPEQGLLHFENHLRKGDVNCRCWLVPGEEAFVLILKKPVPAGVAEQARLGEEYLVHPGSCLVPYLREQF